MEFLIGSEISIYKNVLYKALPSFIVSLCTIIVGLFLLGEAIYYKIKHSSMNRLFSIGMLAIFAGVWRITYGRFIYLMFPESTVLMYTLSLVSLMVIAISMLGCIANMKNRGTKVLVKTLIVIYCIIYSGQFVLQITGLFDLREMLKITHTTLILSALLLCGSDITYRVKKTIDTNGRYWKSYSWLLGAGVMIDLLIYYMAEDFAEMLFTLAAILLYSIIEGSRLMIEFVEQKKMLDDMETQLKLSRTTIMMSQIRSHFVFNILNAISGMYKYDPEKADDTVVRFARYLRNNIGIMENDKNIPFTMDLQQLEDYVALEQVRFGDKIEFYADVEIDDFMISPLILQPIVENAIKHGISKKTTNGTIILRTRDLDDRVQISVEDDGVGFDLKELDKEKSVGLKNIRFRLEHLLNGTMNIDSEPGKGTTVTLVIPKKNGV